MVIAEDILYFTLTMGNSESTPRRVTVENEDEDTIGVVKISESLLDGQENQVKSLNNPSQGDVKNLWQNLLNQKKELDYQQEKIDELLQDAYEQGRNTEAANKKSSPVFVEESLRQAVRDKEREINEIREKKQLHEEEQMRKSKDVEKSVTKEFNDAIEDMQNKFSDRKVGPVCSSLQSHVLDCYEENGPKSLKCSQLVQAYVDCVEQTRKARSKIKSNKSN